MKVVPRLSLNQTQLFLRKGGMIANGQQLKGQKLSTSITAPGQFKRDDGRKGMALT
jgi:hypothetical protein